MNCTDSLLKDIRLKEFENKESLGKKRKSEKIMKNL